MTAGSTRLGRWEKVSYGTGDFASNLIWGTLSSFLMYFYTDVALLPILAIGNIFLISRVLDAFIDPLVGSYVDRTDTKRGRTKPFMFWGVLPLCLFFVLSFTSPDASDTIKIAYAYGTYIVVGLLYSIVNIPYGALMSLMTHKEEEKSQLSALRIVGMAVGSMLVTAITMPLVHLLGQGNMRLGFIETMALYSVAAIVCFGCIIRNCQERNLTHRKAEKHYSLMTVYKKAIHNKPWCITIGFSFLIFVKIGALVAVTIYYCLHVLKDPALISVLLPLQYVSALFSAAITTPFIKKFHYRMGNIIASAVFLLGFCILPLLTDYMPAFIVVYFIATAFGGISMGAVFGMIASCADYNEWKFGERIEGTLYGGYSFATKVGMAFGGAVIGYALAFAGYDAQNITDVARSAISWMYFSVPIVLALLQIVIVYFYPLDRLHEQIVKDLEARHGNSVQTELGE